MKLINLKKKYFFKWGLLLTFNNTNLNYKLMKTKFFAGILFSLILSESVAIDFKTQIAAAKGVLSRLMPANANMFILERA